MFPYARTLWLLGFAIAAAAVAQPAPLAEDALGGETAIKDAPTPYVLIITGNELLRGVYQDGHTQFITRKLEPLGCRCVAALCVGDTRRDLLDALKYATGHAPLVLVTGGLGPTDDDITRETLSEFTGIPIREHPDVLRRMSERFRTPAADLRPNLRRQTQTPVRGRYLENSNGSAVGLVFEASDTVIAAMPGPPRELRPMVENELIPYLAERFGIHTIGSSLQMRFVNIGESNIDHSMHQNMTLPDDLIISSLFELGRVDLTFALPGDSEADRQTLKRLESELLTHVGDFFYTDRGESLETHVLNQLDAKGFTLAVAEVGSGGALSASLSDAPNARGIYLGGWVSPSRAGMAELLGAAPDSPIRSENGADAAKALAELTARKMGSGWAIAVTEAESDADGNRRVWLAYGSPETGFEAKTLGVRSNGETAQKRLVTDALDAVRRKLRDN